MSGSRCHRELANQSPTRPKPVMTSSATKSTPVSRQIVRTSARYPSGGANTPPAPITGSQKNAATRSGPAATIASWRAPGESRVTGGGPPKGQGQLEGEREPEDVEDDQRENAEDPERQGAQRGAREDVRPAAPDVAEAGARVGRAGALSIWPREYILAARAAGKSKTQITVEHIVPNIANQLLVQGTIQFALGILAEAGLSYLGLGAQPPMPSWGRMLFDAQTRMVVAPWMALLPGVAIVITVLGLNLLGDGIACLVDPECRRRYRALWKSRTCRCRSVKRRS